MSFAKGDIVGFKKVPNKFGTVERRIPKGSSATIDDGDTVVIGHTWREYCKEEELFLVRSEEDADAGPGTKELEG